MGAMRALLIEDNQVVADSIRTILVPEDYTVDTVAFGQDGVTTAIRGAYDVIILDLVLPDIDGHDVLQQLREAGADTPILVLSGLEETEHKARCLDAGADDFLTKPLKRTELLARLGALTRREQWDQPLPVGAGRFTVNLDTNTFLMMYR